LLLWQAAAPTGSVVKSIQDFAAAGGVVLMMPTGDGEAGKFRVATWRNADGPLGRTQDGKDLPSMELSFLKRAAISSEGSVLAMFDDSKPLLTKTPVGKGAVYHCATLPDRAWSSLWEGTVLVPMVQRMVQEGVRRLGKIGEADVGDARFTRGTTLASAESAAGASPGNLGPVGAGILQAETRLVALNRPAGEDDSEAMGEEDVREVFGAVPYRLFEDKGAEQTAAQTEMWRWFLILMLLFLTIEAVLALPTKAQLKRWDVPGARVEFRKEAVPGGKA
jgi:hypothetical protein